MSNIWKVILLGIASLVLAGTAFGIVAAQDSGETPSATDTPAATPSDEDSDATPSDAPKDALHDDYLSTLAENLGISQDELEAALKQTALDMVDQAVANGNLTEEQAAEIRDRIESGEAPPFFFGFGRGFHHGFEHGVGAGAKLDEIAGFLGVEVADITSALQDNQSLAQIAEANGKTAGELAAFLLEQVTQKVNDAVANGDMTQERADEILANAPDKIDELINREGLPGPHRGGPGRFPFAPDGGMPVAPEGSVAPETSGIVF